MKRLHLITFGLGLALILLVAWKVRGRQYLTDQEILGRWTDDPKDSGFNSVLGRVDIHFFPGGKVILLNRRSEWRRDNNKIIVTNSWLEWLAVAEGANPSGAKAQTLEIEPDGKLLWRFGPSYRIIFKKVAGG